MIKETGLTLEMAEKEVQKWLDIKKVRPTKREKLKESIDEMVDFFKDGVLCLKEDGCIEQKLFFETGNKVLLTYKNRMSLKDLKEFTSDSHNIKVIAALTGELVGVIESLDSEDLGPGICISSFF